MAPVMKPMAPHRYIAAYISLGLLCGWYYFLLILYPTLIYGIIAYRSITCTAILLLFITLTFTPLDHKPWYGFLNSWIWGVWREYFDFQFDTSSCTDLAKTDKRAIFFEFPHGIFPIGQFVSSSVVEQVTPGKDIQGTGADVIFKVPVMRQLMSWTGTLPAKRSNYTKIFERGAYAAVIPGGIAEMYLVSGESEGIYLKKRKNTVKVAIQEGANIVPVFFFGNTRIFTKVGADGADSWLSKISRKMRSSIVFFYGVHGLPVPYRHPIKLVTGTVVDVKQIDHPTDEEIDEVMKRVIESVNDVYEKRKPDWEDRPLVIS